MGPFAQYFHTYSLYNTRNTPTEENCQRNANAFKRPSSMWPLTEEQPKFKTTKDLHSRSMTNQEHS